MTPEVGRWPVVRERKEDVVVKVDAVFAPEVLGGRNDLRQGAVTFRTGEVRCIIDSDDMGSGIRSGDRFEFAENRVLLDRAGCLAA